MSLHFFLLTVVHAQKQSVPHGLTVNLLSRTGKVYLNGYPSTTPIEKAVSQRENFQFTEISARVPFFGWIVPAQKENTRQTAYRLLVASRKDFLLKDSADLWDSGKVDKNSSANVLYSGKQLAPGKVYFWKVKTWNQQGEESGFSEISAFKTAEELTDYATDRYPIQKQDEYPVKINRIGEIRHFADFGKAAFGRIRVNLYSDTGTDSVIIHLGETEKNGAVNRSPGASIRYSQYKIGLNKGWKTYLVTIRPDKRNTGAQAVLMPEYIG